jgi:hypothetical protein
MKKRQLKKVLLQPGLDIETSAICIAVSWSGLDEHLFDFSCYLQFLNHYWQQFRAGHNKISHLLQYLIVGGNQQKLSADKIKLK